MADQCITKVIRNSLSVHHDISYQIVSSGLFLRVEWVKGPLLVGQWSLTFLKYATILIERTYRTPTSWNLSKCLLLQFFSFALVQFLNEILFRNNELVYWSQWIFHSFKQIVKNVFWHVCKSVRAIVYNLHHNHLHMSEPSCAKCLSKDIHAQDGMDVILWQRFYSLYVPLQVQLKLFGFFLWKCGMGIMGKWLQSAWG